VSAQRPLLQRRRWRRRRRRLLHRLWARLRRLRVVHCGHYVQRLGGCGCGGDCSGGSRRGLGLRLQPRVAQQLPRIPTQLPHPQRPASAFALRRRQRTTHFELSGFSAFCEQLLEEVHDSVQLQKRERIDERAQRRTPHFGGRMRVLAQRFQRRHSGSGTGTGTGTGTGRGGGGGGRGGGGGGGGGAGGEGSGGRG
jgi:hypothetical protein